MAHLVKLARQATLSMLDGSHDKPTDRWIAVNSSEADVSQVNKHHSVDEDEEVPELCDNSISTTKYTVANFLYRNLLEQLSRLANFYFLIIAILSFLPVSPKTPLTSITPLVFVISVSALKEAVEDYSRHQMDLEINQRPARVYRDKAWIDVLWKDIRVGDMVRVDRNHREFPADMILLQSSTPQGMCNIETSNLDGETNLKVKQAIGPSWRIGCAASGDDYPSKLGFVLQSELPNANMDKSSWKGVLYGTKGIAGDPTPMGFSQLLLRGCTLRNTDWIIALVVATGNETKLMLNFKGLTAPKRSNMDLLVDSSLKRIFFGQSFLCVFGSLSQTIWNSSQIQDHGYLQVSDLSFAKMLENFVEAYFSFLVLLDLLIPISLYVSVEVVKLVQSRFINWDRAMYHEETGTPARARTSTLNEELGQVSFIFSDKTGTLTRNIMEFLRCSVGSIAYGPGEMQVAGEIVPPAVVAAGLPPNDYSCFRFRDHRLLAHIDSGSNPMADDFLALLALCHTVLPEIDHDSGEIVYQAASPDEKALVEFAAELQYRFIQREVADIEFRGRTLDAQRIAVNIRGTVHTYDIFEILEFSSARKRMSVILRDSRDGQLKLLCKGADNVVFDRLTDASKKDDWPTTLQNLEKFASEGLRTLCCAYRVISEDELEHWLERHVEACRAMTNRDDLVEESYERIETGLTLIGSTAIEDRLQDGVPEAVASLARAGISIWVLTGDKIETAINIGRSCKLLTHSMVGEEHLIVIDVDERLHDRELVQSMVHSDLARAWELVKDRSSSDPDTGLVVSGKALSTLFPARKRDSKGQVIPPTAQQLAEERDSQSRMLQVMLKCRAVVCCRVSPIQKSQVVDLVKLNVADSITLAIGDGANDVSMIKSAHVGVGISGQEGLQAVMASDFAIAQFCYLESLLLVHGQWSYHRLASLVKYSFYKNAVLSLTQMWFAFQSAFSASLLYDPWSASAFNLVFTALPVMFSASFDRGIARANTSRYPRSFGIGQKRGAFNYQSLLAYLANGLYHSGVIYFVSTLVMAPVSTRMDGQDNDFRVVGTLLFSLIVTVTTAKMALDTKTWTRFTMGAFGLSLTLWFAWALAYNSTLFFPDMFGVAFRLFEMPEFWLGTALAVTLALGPEIAYKYYKSIYSPSLMNVIEQRQYYGLDAVDDMTLTVEDQEGKSLALSGAGPILQVEREPSVSISARESHTLHAAYDAGGDPIRRRSFDLSHSRGYVPFMEDEKGDEFVMPRVRFLSNAIRPAGGGDSELEFRRHSSAALSPPRWYSMASLHDPPPHARAQFSKTLSSRSEIDLHHLNAIPSSPRSHASDSDGSRDVAVSED